MKYWFVRFKWLKTINHSGYGYILVVIDTFSKLGWTFPLKKKSNKIRWSFKYFDYFKTINQKMKSDRGKDFYKNDFGYLFELKGLQQLSRYSVEGPAVADDIIEPYVIYHKSQFWKE